MLRARYNNKINFLISGDFNQVDIQDVLLSYGALHQIVDVATKKGAALQSILTDLHTVMYPPTAQPPIQVDDGKKGKDGDHQAPTTRPPRQARIL